MKKISNKNAFTLIETLVAVTILMIAIAGPLTISMKAYTASLDARNQIIAIFLAQETLEQLNFLKNTNYNFSTCFGDCYVSKAINNSDLSINTCPINACNLYRSDTYGYRYDYQSGSVITPFRRYYNINNGNRVSVTVEWNLGSIRNKVVLNSLLMDVDR